jgi:predicted phage-related endonuclease
MRMKRTGFIGGSDAVQIVHGDWVNLWEIKTGKKKPDDLSNNFAVQSGIWNEPFILQTFERQYKVDLCYYQKEYKTNWLGVPLKGTIDAGVANQMSIVEAKETYQYNTMEKQLDRYMPQIQFYLWISGMTSCYFANKFGNARFECAHIRKDEKYIEYLKSEIVRFWSYVTTETCPELGYEDHCDLPEPDTDKILINNKIKRDGSKDNYFTSLAHSYIDSMPMGIKHEEIKKELKTLIAEEERELYCDTLSLRKDKRGAIRIIVTKGDEQ